MIPLTPQARFFAALQRTDLLPKQNRVAKALRSYRFPGFDYETFVRKVTDRDADGIDSRFWASIDGEVKHLLPHIPKNTSTIMDIGAGLAGMDLLLTRHFQFESIALVDRSHQDQRVYYEFEERGSFYNSFDLAKELLTQGGVDPESIVCISAPDDGRLPPAIKDVDLVISTLSWGFHYPVSFYLASVKELLSARGVLILDVRIGTGGLEDLLVDFHVEIISRGTRAVRVLARRRGL